MEYRSQKTSFRVAVVVALLSIGSAGATELTYDVRHHREVRDHFGLLTITEKGVSYQQVLPERKRDKHPKKPPHLDSFRLDYQDIQELWVSPDRLVVVTYRDRKALLGLDKEFEFFLPKDKSFADAYALLKDRLDRRFVAAVADSVPGVLWEIPVKLLGVMQGSEGVLQFGPDRIVYKTDSLRQSRTWRYQDIENISTSDRYQLTITTYERARTHYGSMKGFNFQLKQPLDDKRFEAIWKRLNQDKGLEFLTSIQERNQSTK